MKRSSDHADRFESLVLTSRVRIFAETHETRHTLDAFVLAVLLQTLPLALHLGPLLGTVAHR